MQLPHDWASLIKDWERALKAENKSDRTIGIYTTAARDFGLWVNREDDIAPDEAGTHEVRDFVAHLIERTSPGNANTNYRALQQWFKFLIIEDEIETSPMVNMKPPYVPEKPVPIVPDDLLKRVLETCKGKDFQSRRDTALVRIFFDTGARLSEIANLTLDDIDFNVDAVRVVGKGSKERVVPFSPNTGTALSRYLRARKSHKLSEHERVWLGIKNRGPMTPNGIGQMLRRRGREVGVEAEMGRHLHAHLGRHAASHHWQANGGSESDLMLVMGWTSPQMPKRYGKSAAVERAHASARKLRLGDRF
ncbi:tyrosine-type recombinase/integrase [Amycolatopsis sp. CB00013]|uniref:tyrosine-type recombinase/integrase n=1 Tax=Amycolatopsis sp. CB00013 TaxID=1703945 RepID=UPI0009399594|nr:tyrosine-type recombinase/integrase [Amycolatopsis sp. CB00013]OKJ98845.1 hypothetical protein AMK34_18730 [Amycolatopsis sp. CB00013]